MVELIIDHPKVRDSLECPTCQGYKEKDLIVCWSCYRKYSLRYGNAACETIIDDTENRL